MVSITLASGHRYEVKAPLMLTLGTRSIQFIATYYPQLLSLTYSPNIEAVLVSNEKEIAELVLALRNLARSCSQLRTL